MKRERQKTIGEYSSYIIVCGLSFALSRAGHHYASGILLMLEALVIYLSIVRTSGNLVELRGLFTLAWVGGQGIACLQLSKLQNDWDVVTWICFGLAYVCFGAGYCRKKENQGNIPEERENMRVNAEGDFVKSGRLFLCIVGLALVSVICFFIEAAVVGFVPLFSDAPHAYSYFHVSGVHYFTISCILIPAISVIYLKYAKGCNKGRILVLGVCNVIALAVPILCVSRFQLLFAVGFALVVYIILYKHIKPKTLVILLLTMIPVYVLLTVARNHDVEYLNGIFEMKNKNMPIFVTQPYMYVANNFENFNCLVEQMVHHTYGLRMLFPVIALTGLKFVFPQLTASPIYITKPELTTLTMFYDAYYDFGILGIAAFALVLGLAARKISNSAKKAKNPVLYLLYGQMAIYLGLSFFTTWFSNPTTWFWFALTGVMYVFVGYQKKEKKEV